ncbi:MAG: hypothetical protein R3B07_04465 [Polyangiaceae bacterium]
MTSPKLSLAWETHFVWYDRCLGATTLELDELAASLLAPLAPEEQDDLRRHENNPFPPSDPLFKRWKPTDFSAWKLPAPPSLPAAWLSLLRFSNGGSVLHEDMEFAFFGTAKVREYALAYHFPHYMPEAVPLGLDGSGNFAVLDVRELPVDGEYPILLSSAGNLGFEDAVLLGQSFLEFCSWTRRLEEAFDD